LSIKSIPYLKSNERHFAPRTEVLKYFANDLMQMLKIHRYHRQPSFLLINIAGNWIFFILMITNFEQKYAYHAKYFQHPR